MELGVEIYPNAVLEGVAGGKAELSCAYSGERRKMDAPNLLLVTARLPKDELYQELAGAPEKLEGAGIKSLKLIGDAYGPSTVAAAVYSGHRYARELEAPDPGDAAPFKREVSELAAL
jgi:dimethylamine/trimethylamine dehydrogenase